jgi:hypothetical protein
VTEDEVNLNSEKTLVSPDVQLDVSEGVHIPCWWHRTCRDQT